MKKRYNIVFLGIVVSLLFISLFAISVNAQSSYTYVLSSEEYLDEANYPLDSLFNLRNQTVNTQTYNASFTFTNDTIGGKPLGWFDGSLHAGDSDYGINATYLGHDMVLNLTADTGNEYSHTYTAFTSGSSGFVEFYLLADDTTEFGGDAVTIATDEGASGTSHVTSVYISNEVIYATQTNGAGGTQAINMGAIANFTWVHIIVEYEFSTDTLSVWRDGVNYIDSQNFPYDNDFTTDEVDVIEVFSWHDNLPSTSFYVDAIGYTDDPFYIRGDNYYPLRNLTGYLEVDKYDWTLYGVDTAYTHSDEVVNPQGWTTTNPETQLWYTHSFGNGREIDLYWFGVGNEPNYNTLLAQDFNDAGSNWDYYEISWEFYPTQLENNNGLFELLIDSADDTRLFEIRGLTVKAETKMTTWYWNGGWNQFLLPLVDIDEAHYYRWDLSWVSGFEFGKVELYEDNVLMGSWWIDFVDSGTGIGTVTVELSSFNAPGDVNLIAMEDFKIDKNGESFYDDGFGFATIDLELDAETWDFDERSNILINTVGNLSVGGSQGVYTPDISEFELADSNIYVNNEILNWNGFGKMSGDGLTNPYLHLYIQDENVIEQILNSIRIDGVVLNEGTNEYFMIFDSSGITTNDSYFYVDDTSGQLRYRLNTDDTDPEWILCEFDIPDTFTEDRRLLFRSDINGMSDGYMRVNYTDATSSIFQIPTYATKTANVLPQSKYIATLIVQITDNDNVDINDETTGYVSELEILFSGDITTSITTINLVNVLVPLIIMFVPTFAIYERYGKSTIVPVFIFMTIICFASGLIPTWLFFIIMIASAGFIFMEKKRRDL